MAKKIKQVSLGFPKGYIAQDGDEDPIVYWYKRKPTWDAAYRVWHLETKCKTYCDLYDMFTKKQIKELFGDAVGADRIVRVV